MAHLTKNLDAKLQTQNKHEDNYHLPTISTPLPVQHNHSSISLFYASSDLDDQKPLVLWHRNSPEPAKLGVDALLQNSHIHTAPGQDQCLAHELAHLQLKHPQRAAPNTYINQFPVCSREDFEQEANRLSTNIRLSEFQLLQSPPTPLSYTHPILCITTPLNVLARYQNSNHPAKTLQRKNFTEYQRMLYWLSHAISECQHSISTQTVIFRPEQAPIILKLLTESQQLTPFIACCHDFLFDILKFAHTSGEDFLRLIIFLAEMGGQHVPFHEAFDQIFANMFLTSDPEIRSTFWEVFQLSNLSLTSIMQPFLSSQIITPDLFLILLENSADTHFRTFFSQVLGSAYAIELLLSDTETESLDELMNLFQENLHQIPAQLVLDWFISLDAAHQLLALESKEGEAHEATVVRVLCDAIPEPIRAAISHSPEDTQLSLLFSAYLENLSKESLQSFIWNFLLMVFQEKQVPLAMLIQLFQRLNVDPLELLPISIEDAVESFGENSMKFLSDALQSIDCFNLIDNFVTSMDDEVVHEVVLPLFTENLHIVITALSLDQKLAIFLSISDHTTIPDSVWSPILTQLLLNSLPSTPHMLPFILEFLKTFPSFASSHDELVSRIASISDHSEHIRLRTLEVMHNYLLTNPTLRTIHQVKVFLKPSEIADIVLKENIGVQDKKFVLDIINEIITNFISFSTRSKKKTLSLASVHPRHIIPYSDIKGFISVAFSKVDSHYAQIAASNIGHLISILCYENTEYDQRIRSLWNDLSGYVGEDLSNSRVRFMVDPLIPLLANHPRNIFMGDGPENIALANRFDYSDEALSIYSEEYMSALLEWWRSSLGSIGIDTWYDEEAAQWESEISRSNPPPPN